MSAQAVGLGDLTLESNLFQPLQATIEVYGIDTFETENLRVAIADQAAFLRAQLERHPILNNIQLEVSSGDDGIVRIRLTSSRALREPLVPLLIDTEWPGGRLLREYTLMLDPPLAPTPPSRQAVAGSAPARPATSATVPGSAVPAAVSVATLDVRGPSVSETSTAARPDVYGPVQRNEMLGNIARDLRPLDSITLNQMMLALVEANPEAFILGNVNGLKAGVSLDVPDVAQIQSFSRAEANSRLALHHAAWAARKTLADYQAGSQSPAAAATSPDTAPESPAAAAGSASAEAGSEPSGLRLEPTLPPQPASPLATAAGVSEKARLLELELADTRASLAEREEKLDELQTRMAVYGAELERLRQQLENYQMEQAAAASAAQEQVRAAAASAEPAVEAGSFFPWLVGGLLGGLGLSGLGWFLAGRRRAGAERALDVREVIGDEGFTDMVENLAASTAMREARAAMATSSVDILLPDTDEMHQVVEQSEDEVLSEVDVFVAYGLVDRAREVLQEAIAEDPDNVVYRERLRQIDAEPEADAEADGHEMDGILVQSDNGEDARKIWARFAEMGLKLPPESAVIDLGAAEVNKTVVWDPADDAPEGSTQTIDPVSGDIEEIDFDLPAEVLASADAGEPDAFVEDDSLFGDTRSFDVPPLDRDRTHQGAVENEATQAYTVEHEDEAGYRPDPASDDEPTIEVSFDLDVDELEALMATAEDSVDADDVDNRKSEDTVSEQEIEEEIDIVDAAPEILAPAESTHEWNWPGAEDYEGAVTPRRKTEEFTPDSSDSSHRDDAPRRQRDAGADYYSDATQVMRSATVEQRSAADFIVDWQLDQDATDSGTFDLPGEEDLLQIEDDETQQWVVPTELREAVDAEPEPEPKSKSKSKSRHDSNEDD